MTIVDPYTPIDYFYEVEGEEDLALITPKLKIGLRIFDIGPTDQIFPTHAILCGVERSFPLPFAERWLFRDPVILQGKDLNTFFDALHKDDTAPALVWKKKPSPFPHLLLKDARGMEAELAVWDEYRLRPLKPEESGWEQELMAVGYQKRTGYSCSSDRVLAALSTLLSKGWKIRDFQKRIIVPLDKITASVREKDGALHLEGSVGQKPLASVLSVFKKGDLFLPASEDTVWLLDLPQGWKKLSPSMPRHHFGVLQDLNLYEPASWQEVNPASTFQGHLYPYQQKGVSWLYFLSRSGFHGLLADEMGLGKTVQLLAFFSLLENKGPILIVMPSSLLVQWKKEIERFLPSKTVHLHHGSERQIARADIILTSYALLRQDREIFHEMEFHVLILDEAQAIKNAASQTAQIACSLKAQFRLAVTGTPIENRLADLESLFHFLMPGFGDLDPKKIRPFILRRTKESVDLELPERLEQLVFVDLSAEERAFYDETRKRLHASMPQNKLQILTAILRLRQIACHAQLAGGPPISSKLERLLADIEEAAGHKILVYSQFTEMLRLIATSLKEKDISFVYLDGSTSNRAGVVEEFQNDPSVSVFLISLKAGGVGLNLTAADYVMLYDPWWNSAAEEQAIARAHRFGQQKPVIVRRYVSSGTIEERVLELKTRKAQMVSDWIEDEEPPMEELLALEFI
ncbi:MAG: DEAD/DEAH box helicase [Verrucomicrobia bacterium]|nr:DEAD/DEAH box helicase [Verrucomicrobiota bacterium]